jgi:hypothetical protein
VALSSSAGPDLRHAAQECRDQGSEGCFRVGDLDQPFEFERDGPVDGAPDLLRRRPWLGCRDRPGCGGQFDVVHEGGESGRRVLRERTPMPTNIQAKV